MTKRQAGLLNILLAIAFALAILASSVWLSPEVSQITTWFLIAIWFVPFCALSSWGNDGGCSCEWRWLKQRFSRNV